MLFADALSIVIGVGGCWWPISDRAILIEVYFWQFSKNPPSSTSVADAIKFLMMMNSTYTGPFSGGISWIGVLEFGPRKKVPPDVLRALGYDT